MWPDDLHRKQSGRARRDHHRGRVWEQLLASWRNGPPRSKKQKRKPWWTPECPATCRRKQPLESEEEALKMKARMMLHRPLEGDLQAYQCRWCGKWYLGRRRNETAPE